jgi:3-oxosteroid 1-dehydrogenase
MATTGSTSSTDEVDVIVVGAGAAGLVAAATAAGEGASVALLERGVEVGGTATVSIGEFWIPNNRHIRELGIEDPESDCLALMARLSFPDSYDPASPTLGLTALQHELLRTFYRRADEAVGYLDSLGALRSRISPAFYGDPLGHPEYHSDLLENRVPQGRHLIVDDGDPALGLRGRAYVEQLSGYLARASVSIRTEHRVVDVLRDGDRVIGVIAESPDGSRSILARRGVIFATGGFGHDDAARSTYLTGPVDAVAAVETNTGDFLRIGMKLGAGLGSMTTAYLGNASFELGRAAARLPALIHFPFGDSMIWVDRTGRRVVNEKGVFSDRAQVHFDWDAGERRHSKRVLFQIFDQPVFDAPGNRYPLPAAGTSADHVIEGQTWAELAARLDARLAELSGQTGGIRLAADFASTLQSSVLRFDAHAQSGIDLDFARGSTPIQTCYEPRLHADNPNVTMAPFRSVGPYYAMLIGAAMFDTSGGPMVDSLARVLDTGGLPIPGLFGAGCCVADAGGQAYWSGGAPIGLALTFGYLAGLTAAKS